MQSIANRPCPGCRALNDVSARQCASCRLDFDHYDDVRTAPASAFAFHTDHDAVRVELPRCATCGDALPVTGWDPMRPHVCSSSETRVRTLDDGRQAYEDRQETIERAAVVAVILERCKEELARLEVVPHLGAEEVNALSAAKGFAARAEAALKSGLGL